MTLTSLSAAAVQLRILWACLRWDDMAAKPPAGGTNTISTETEITTTELLKRREVGMDNLRSEFLVRKIVVPLGVADKPKEKYTPQRSGLRERKKAEPIRQTEPSVNEVWVPEEVLELWEIKQFGEKLEKQRQALQEKAKEAAATASQQEAKASQQTAIQIKAQMEEQLKQQRLALAQKRLQENQANKTSTTTATTSTSNATTIIINSAGKSGSAVKTLTVTSSSSLLSSSIIKTMQQPKTIIANPGSLLGSQVRSGIRVQLPSSAIQLRPQTVTLAPKPGNTSGSGISTITRLISPSAAGTRIVSPATPQSKTQTIQIRPPNSNQPVQNLQFIQQPNGQLQVKGLLPGQIIQRMPDGKLQILTVNNSAAASSTSTTTNTATASSSPLTTALQPRTPTISIRPQQTIVMSNTNTPVTAVPAHATSTTPNRLVIPAQISSNTLTLPTPRPILGGTVISSTPQKHMIITRPAGTAQVIATPHGATPTVVSLASTGGMPSLNSAVIISAPSIVNNASSSSVGSSGGTVLVNNSQPPQALLTPAGLVNVQGNAIRQTLLSTLRPTLVNLPSSQAQVSGSSTMAVTGSLSSTTTPNSQPTSLLTGQIISGTSLLPRPSTSLLNLPTVSGGTLTLTASAAASNSQIPKLLNSPAVGAQIIRPPGSTQAQLVIRPGSTLLSGGTPAKVFTAQQLKGLTSGSPIHLKPATSASMSPIKTILSPPSSTNLILSSQPSLIKTATPSVHSLVSNPNLQQATSTALQQTTVAATPKQPSAIVERSAPSLSVDISPAPGSTDITSPIAGGSPGAGGAPKYAITPQVVEQVVRQALLQNQAPEIQQKLLAMQRQIQQQRTTVTTPSTNTMGLLSISGSGKPLPTHIHSTPTPIRSVPVSSTTSENRSAKSKGMTPEQREEQSRNAVCSQVMKTMLDRIERDEKQEQRNKKKQESAEEKQKRLAMMSQQKSLFRHKEALKKEILRKRSLMEKNLQQEIYNELADKVKKAKLSQNQAKSPTPGSTAAVPTPVTMFSKKAALKELSKSTPTELSPPDKKAATSVNRKRKQKIISTGIKSLNPKEKLYCVCKTPYDDTRFYIGCDLCSDWFHGVCVNINEDQAKFIDSYICEECRKQQENTSEELYCLCRTPYDENQFYIGCDRCQDWFHGYCVGISKHEADSIDIYVCPRCQKEEKTDPIAQRPLNQSEYMHLIKLVKEVKVHKMAWPFLNPVDPREVPDYYNIIAEPIDLTIVEHKLATRSYDKLNDFVKDITKIFDNCRFYNPVGTPYYQCAEVVETFFAQKIKALRGANKL